MPTAPTSPAQLIDLIRRAGIVSPEKLATVSETALPSEPQKAAAALVAQGVVTRFQASQLLAGRHKGFKIGPYTILDLLGRGGMGAVYLGEHGTLNRKVAIKVLVTGKDENQKLALGRFQREARAAAALDHPNIVRIFDVAQVGGVPFLVMEYVDGETLQHLLDRDGPLPYSTAAEYVAQAAAGLQHAHEKGFIHRDIKPGNLMLDRTGTIKIMDMGLARSVQASDQVTEKLDNGAVVGTADFIAPEQAINNSSVDIRADIYSLGASLYSLIVGKPPFDGNTTQKLLQHQLRTPPTLAAIDATLPPGLSQVVEKMLSKKPTDRYRTPAEVLVALTPWMAASSRVLIGITNTSMAADEELQATLSGIHRKGSSGRLADSGEVALEAGKDTTELSSSKTRKEIRRPAVAPVGIRRYRKPLAAGLAAAVAAIVGVGIWLAFGQTEKAAAGTEKTAPVPTRSSGSSQEGPRPAAPAPPKTEAGPNVTINPNSTPQVPIPSTVIDARPKPK